MFIRFSSNYVRTEQKEQCCLYFPGFVTPYFVIYCEMHCKKCEGGLGGWKTAEFVANRMSNLFTIRAVLNKILLYNISYILY
jgi:hypothetical protein